MLMSLEYGTQEEKYRDVAKFLLMKYHLIDKKEFKKVIFEYANKHNLSAKKLGTLIYQLGDDNGI